ncbi:MAG: nuclear transport factor 2 family protein [Gammaproteobacteria bacterium]|nr:nuclear transport factor 2 family protein [Gammaproteobacteria bacterium]
MTTPSTQVWQAFMQSMQAGDNHWQSLVSDDVVFTGPVEQVRGKDDFIKLNLDFFKMVVAYDLHHQAAGENTVATEGTIKIKSPKGNELAFDLAEFYNIKDGKIQSVSIYYDPREFIQEFSM